MFGIFLKTLQHSEFRTLFTVPLSPFWPWVGRFSESFQQFQLQLGLCRNFLSSFSLVQQHKSPFESSIFFQKRFYADFIALCIHRHFRLESRLLGLGFDVEVASKREFFLKLLGIFFEDLVLVLEFLDELKVGLPFFFVEGNLFLDFD